MKIGIIGIGLIGGSILKALSKDNIELFCVTKNNKTKEKLQQYTSNISSELSIVKDCEIIFVCTPMRAIIQTLDELEQFLPTTAIVVDVGGLKSFVMVQERPYIFIGSHPMAGTENKGFDASIENLFENAKWVITKNTTTPDFAVEKVKDIINKMGAKIIETDAKSHDLAVAKISHMPMFLAQALVNTIKNDELAQELAASGFRDMTRLALSNSEMAEDMINMNKSNINTALENLQNSFNYLCSNYADKISELSELRKLMYDKNGKNLL